jgi:hypothetical protein
MVRKFLSVVAALTVLVIAGLFALRFWAQELSEIAFVPKEQFKPAPPLATSVYDDPKMWIAQPGMGANDPTRWMPRGMAGTDGQALPVAVFFVHPTSYLANSHWNAPLDDAESKDRAALFVKVLASPFNGATEIWAPRYRQAALGAFLTEKKAGGQAVELAYGDVLQAFDHFIARVPPGRPIVIAGHSQGALITMRLLKDRVAGKPLARRIAAAYVIGWPVNLAHDLPVMGLPACAAPDQPGCVVSWSSWAEPAEPPPAKPGIPAATALDGGRRFEGAVLCTNPLTGTIGATAPATANRGTLVPTADLKAGEIKPSMVPARCSKEGLLLIGPPPQMGPFVAPGNNYHVYDIPLFWTNLREDFARRVGAWRP